MRQVRGPRNFVNKLVMCCRVAPSVLIAFASADDIRFFFSFLLSSRFQWCTILQRVPDSKIMLNTSPFGPGLLRRFLFLLLSSSFFVPSAALLPPFGAGLLVTSHILCILLQFPLCWTLLVETASLFMQRCLSCKRAQRKHSCSPKYQKKKSNKKSCR